MKNINSFFSPKSIAIVGASPKSGKLGNVLIENIKKGGWRGKLYLVNPKYAKSRKDYFSNLSKIKKPVDLVLAAIPAPLVGEIIGDGAKAGPKIKNFVIISSGFKESGIEGKKLEENLQKLAQKYDLNILGPNCLGFTNPKEKLNATFTDGNLRQGNTAIVSQSGALAVALLDWAENKNIGFSKIVSIGNKTDLDESDVLNYLVRDKNTKAIALYLEDIKNGSGFMHALAGITHRRPVIVLKAGKTSIGQKAITSHTGSLAQNEEIIEAVFEKLNIISVSNIEEFQDIIYYLNSNPVPAKKEILILTNAGGPGVMATDFIGKSKNIQLLNLSPDFKEEIKKYLPASASAHNPIDVIGDARPERYQKALEIIAKKYPKYPIIAILTPQNQTDPEKVALIVAKMKKKLPNLSVCFMGGEKIARAKIILEKNKISNFENPERVLAVIEKLARYRENAQAANGFDHSEAIPKIHPIIKKALSEKRNVLFWRETENLFRKYTIQLTQSVSCRNISDLKDKKISFPCALKTDDPAITHRWEKKAVILNIQNKKELEAALEKIKKTTQVENFLVQPMAAPGLELIIGMKRDPVFGPVILCGWGGTFTEIFKDKAIFIPPLTQRGIESKLSQLEIFPILKGFRGEKGYDIGAISKIILNLSKIASENLEIKEIDINPLMIYNNGQKGIILDAKIFLS